MNVITRRHFISALAFTAAAQSRSEPDWPQWRGADRSNVSRETGLLKQWPANGPKLLWSARGLGNGYGTVSIKGSRIYVQGTKDRQSVVFALNRANGQPVWHVPLGTALDQDRGPGPRSTPTVDGDFICAMSENGDVVCFRAEDGRGIWKKNIRDFSGRNPNWLISESPLVDGQKLIFTPGGERNGMVAVDKSTGRDLWVCRELNDAPGYASCIVADVGGVRTIMNLTSRAGVGVRASDGKLFWRYEAPANRIANCTTPVFHDNKVFYTSAYGTGGGLLALEPQAGGISTREVYFTRDMQNHHGGVLLYNGHLYGFSNAILTCLDFGSGAVKWRDRSVGKGSLTCADGNLYILSENNVLALAAASPDRYVEKGRVDIEDQGRPSWAHPVVCGGRLYVRNQGYLNCYNVAG
ncbi:MAG TPA: PQQ-binding-like beta-propeller repeat protein [Bryobacteraceae bacterium]|nr:PQQ-binding-like beta-propeller repeat protein [Bryobacteraceae bacterium]